jgi:hypothetical protein
MRLNASSAAVIGLIYMLYKCRIGQEVLMCSFFAGLSLLILVLVVSPSSAQGSCSCPGQRGDNFSGGMAGRWSGSLLFILSRAVTTQHHHYTAI